MGRDRRREGVKEKRKKKTKRERSSYICKMKPSFNATAESASFYCFLKTREEEEGEHQGKSFEMLLLNPPPLCDIQFWKGRVSEGRSARVNNGDESTVAATRGACSRLGPQGLQAKGGEAPPPPAPARRRGRFGFRYNHHVSRKKTGVCITPFCSFSLGLFSVLLLVSRVCTEK